MLTPLARAGMGIFPVSTFDTDEVAVHQQRLHTGLDALRADRHTNDQRRRR